MTHWAPLEANQRMAKLCAYSVALASSRHPIVLILLFLGTCSRKWVNGLRFFSMAFIELG